MNANLKKISELAKKVDLSQLFDKNAVAATAATPAQPQKSTVQKIADTGLEVLKAVGPELIGLIPGVGPIAKGLLSTLNDDEWFSEFSAAGATFNEFLEVGKVTDATQNGEVTSTFLSGIAACIEVPTTVNFDTAFTDQYMPSVLAYVRNKTDNVLADDTELYTQAFIAAQNLYALYYEGKKFIELSETQPLNIPLLPRLLAPIQPSSYSAFKGVVDSLGNYLKTAVGLPYALTEYIRWRFGTTFTTSNTGNPGLVFYDWYDPEESAYPTAFWGVRAVDAPVFLERYQSAIDKWMQKYKAAGRAGADLKLAYADHQVRYDVEKRHYDEKEFNLRCNMGPSAKLPGSDSTAILYMDSRLAASPALQAVTLSTGLPNGLAPFPVREPVVAFYLANDITPQYGTLIGDEQGAVTVGNSITLTVGWHFAVVYNNTQIKPSQPLVLRNGLKNEVLNRPEVLNNPFWYCNTDGAPSTRRWSFSGGYNWMTGLFTVNTSITEIPEAATTVEAFERLIATIIADSLQLHNTGRFAYFNQLGGKVPFALTATMLAYDMARTTYTQVASIQRTAIRNLIRGNYKAKTPVVRKPEVQKAVADVEVVATKDVLEHAPAVDSLVK